MRSEDETQSSRRLLRKWDGTKPKPKRKRRVPWKLIAVVLVAVVVAAAVIVLKPWEGGEGEPQTQLRLFIWGAELSLVNTEDNLPIENVEIYTPFPKEFENLHFRFYLFETENGWITVSGGNVIENTLVGQDAPVFSVEDTEVGKRAVIRIAEMYPGDNMIHSWGFMAPKNISLYDVPNENRAKAFVGFTPEKTIHLTIWASLTDTERETSWVWSRIINDSGWTDAPSENIF